MRYNIDFFELGNTQIINVVQGDSARVLEFFCEDYTIPSGAVATYYVARPSKVPIYNQATIINNTVIVPLTAESISEAGENLLQVRIDHNDALLTSFSVVLMVRKFGGADAVESTGEVNIFDHLVEEAMEYISQVIDPTLTIEDKAADAKATGEAIQAVIQMIQLYNLKNGTGQKAIILNDLDNGTASGNYSFSSGYKTEASGAYSHSEGRETVASQSYAHAEGFKTEANYISAHSEGELTEASGANSHAEGRKTVANHASQHVFGEYNIPDPSSASRANRGTYVEIVGNGNSSTPSNARTLDWNGNETLKGKLTVGSQPTSDMDAATKKYVDDAVDGASSVTVVGTGLIFT